MKKYLLTGIPRSGTTLSCKILNSLDNVIALHEPLSPNKLKSTSKEHAIGEINNEIKNLEKKLINGEAFEHGSAQSLILDNPIQERHSGELRRLQAKRGLLTLPPQPETTNLIVKQNALFAALLPEAAQHYDVVSIIRNPVDVFLSWMSVDLPINRGRIPGGERFSLELKQKLDLIPDIAKRQVVIYQWFLKQYQKYASQIVTYEDITSTQGHALVKAFGLSGKPNVEIKNIIRQHDQKIIKQLNEIISVNIIALSNEFYRKTDIEHRLEQVSAFRS